MISYAKHDENDSNRYSIELKQYEENDGFLKRSSSENEA